MVGQKHLGFLAVFILFISLSFVIAVDSSVTINNKASNVTYYFYSLNNSANFTISAGTYSLNQTNFSLNGITLIPSTNGTTAFGTLVNSSTLLSYTNNTGNLTTANSNKSYWFNFSAPADGVYTIVVTRMDAFGALNATTVTLNVNTSIPSSSRVNLRTAGNFVVLSKSGISTTGTTNITGDIGVSPIDSTAITGFSPVMDSSNQFSTSSYVDGSIYAANYANPTPAKMTQAVSDMETAYTDAAGRPADVTELGAGNLGGLTIAPGVYEWSTGVTIPTDVTLSGNSTAVWIFNIAGTLTTSSSTQVILSGGANASNIFWRVAGQTTLGTNSNFSGNILDYTAIVINTGAKLDGRALAQTAVTLDANTISLTGGTSSYTPSLNVTILRPADYLNTSATGIFILNATVNNTGTANISYAYFNVTYSNNTAIAKYIASNLSLNSNNSFIRYSNSSWNISSYTDGTYKVKFWINDTAGNTNTGELANFILDRTAPSRLNFTLLFIERTALVFSVNITDSTSGVSTSCAVNDGTVVGTGTSQNISQSSLTCGSTYTYIVNCSDSAGNTNSTSVSYTTSACGVSRGSETGSGSLSSGSSVSVPKTNTSVSTPVASATPTTAAPTTEQKETPAPLITDVTPKSNTTRNVLIVVGILAILGILGYVLMRKK